MAKRLNSIFTDDMHTCWLTGQSGWIERHHIFGGFSSKNRQHSEEYGLVIPVEHSLHNERPYGIHFNEKLDLAVKQFAQRKFEEEHSREEFVLIFGKNYIYDEENDGYEINLRELGVPVEMLFAG